ncbi:hypothetical protein POSPLADRAFT_1153981 [Postia placenta MAD-698-R-SB12]|uniref:FAD linked oxidase N-terminal domain-containing protein n=1 Tax=Postia placenta MAD-698-R-SB12 TaxID=670580 RepID=A0A1X6MQC6_9APHY|nr:hypothetical protein POSPLADRAFT_1153981 [Postia placenta MAD-698-R-SB12]OSX58402.1 hypothetical protein POSPLADRAFT_1153981 [Postia placenta MAD-698-R-SB12]
MPALVFTSNVVLPDSKAFITQFSAFAAKTLKKSEDMVSVSYTHNGTLAFGATFDPTFVLEIISIGNLDEVQNNEYSKAFFAFLSENLGVPHERGYMSLIQWCSVLSTFADPGLINMGWKSATIAHYVATALNIVPKPDETLQQPQFQHNCIPLVAQQHQGKIVTSRDCSFLMSLLVSSIAFGIASAADGPDLYRRDALSVCQEIASAISSASEVFYPLEWYYTEDIAHYISSSEENATCSVEPGTPEDVGIIVKGGGHASNPGFSSTAGVQVAMARFNGVTYNSDSQTVDIGTGLIWDDVYSALEPYDVNVVGGRVTGVGVAGFTLGGGKSRSPHNLRLLIILVRRRLFVPLKPVWSDRRHGDSIPTCAAQWDR